VRVACLGDSITAGSGATPPARFSYPAQLGGLLGAGYDVRNFEVGSTTLLTEGDLPYRKTPRFSQALAFDPDVVLVLLGVNDTCAAPRNNWDLADSFLSDATGLLRDLKRPGRRVIVALPCPMFPHLPGLAAARTADLEARSPRLERVRGWWQEAARAEGVEVVDLGEVLSADPLLVLDGVHLTAAGYERMAKRFRDAVVSGLQAQALQSATIHQRPAARGDSP
jgi:lysophospholipase L1-like esterase